MNKEFWLGAVGALLVNGLYLALALSVDRVWLYLLCLPFNAGLLLALLWFGRVEAVRGAGVALFFTFWLGGGCLILLMLGAILI